MDPTVILIVFVAVCLYEIVREGVKMIVKI